MQTGSDFYEIDPRTFTISYKGDSGLFQRAVARYMDKLLFPLASVAAEVLAGQRPSGSSSLATLSVSIASSNESLFFGVDESYSLEVNGSGATLSAATVFGGLRGLESFSQLVQWNATAGAYRVISAPVSVHDAPRFAWRGLLIDSARHYLPVSAILRTIEAMAFAKLNVLHWHLIDAESFPVASEAFPLLSERGRYAPRAYYSPKDVTAVIEFARDRGVRVVPEFDTPGHAYSWGLGYPNVTAKCPKFAANINNIPLSPAQPFTFEVVAGFLGDMAALFADEYMHFGGDEVVLSCWLEDPDVVAWMKRKGYTTGAEVEQFYEDWLDGVAKALPRRKVVWQDLFDNGITMDPADTIVEVWRSPAELQSVVRAGFRGIQAAGYYLDQQIPNPKQTWYEWVDTWKNFWLNDPTAGLTPDEAKLVQGGEACMWGEQVDARNIDSRVWPRAAGAAERFWSASATSGGDPTQALPRLMAWRCTIAQRGIGAGPIAPDYCELPSSATV